MTIQIETMEHAPEFVQKIAADLVGKPKAFAKIRIFDESAAQHSVLRDRTQDCVQMLRGLVGNLKAPTFQFNFTGRELREHGCDYIVGAAFAQNFRIIFI